MKHTKIFDHIDNVIMVVGATAVYVLTLYILFSLS